MDKEEMREDTDPTLHHSRPVDSRIREDIGITLITPTRSPAFGDRPFKGGRALLWSFGSCSRRGGIRALGHDERLQPLSSWTRSTKVPRVLLARFPSFCVEHRSAEGGNISPKGYYWRIHM